MRGLTFSDKFEASVVCRATVPAGIQSKSALMQALALELQFPDYFGHNWDALDECIRDLSWLPPGDVAVVHEDLPLSEDLPSLSIYLSVLMDAIEVWNTVGSNLIFVSPEEPTGEHALLERRKLFVVFPSAVQDIVKNVVVDKPDA